MKTKWFPYNINPIHIGLYENIYRTKDGAIIRYFDYFDGVNWKYRLAKYVYWRGLTKEKI